jgi:outer membrane immunogenic protein
MHMKKFLTPLVFAAAAAVIAGPAFAADMATRAPVYTKAPAPIPVYSWTGFYVGLNGGGGWNNTTGDQSCLTPGPAFILAGPGCSTTTTGTLKPSGGLFGGQAGYNWQTGMWVWGIETDIQWSGIKDAASFTVPCCLPGLGTPGAGTTSQNLDWFGTVRGRLGITVWDRGLLYGTGGLIYGEEKVSETVTFPAVAYGAAASSTRTGWTAGAGFEYAFTNNVTGKVEGLWYDMGSQTIGFTSPVTNFTENGTFNYKGALVRAGLNWKF